MDPLAPAQPAPEPTKRQLAEENAALKARVLDLEAQVAALSADLDAAKAAPPPAPALVPSQAWVLKTALRHSGQAYAVGDLLPFDPASPPPGCDGLVEGVHYELARVLRAD